MTNDDQDIHISPPVLSSSEKQRPLGERAFDLEVHYQSLGQKPTMSELARELGCTRQQLYRLGLRSAKPYRRTGR